MKTDKVYLSKNLVEHFYEIADFENLELYKAEQDSKSSQKHCEKSAKTSGSETEDKTVCSENVEQVNRDIVKKLLTAKNSTHTAVAPFVSSKETGFWVVSDRLNGVGTANSCCTITIDVITILKDLGLNQKAKFGIYEYSASESLKCFSDRKWISNNIRNSPGFGKFQTIKNFLKDYVPDKDLKVYFAKYDTFFGNKSTLFVFKDKVVLVAPPGGFSSCSNIEMVETENSSPTIILRGISKNYISSCCSSNIKIVLWIKLRKIDKEVVDKKNTVETSPSTLPDKTTPVKANKPDSRFPAEFFMIADNIRANLPYLKKDTLFSSISGIYDLVPSEPPSDPDDPYVQVQLDQECSFSDPWRFVKENEEVAIDFGTSSTVVAFCDDRGREQLLKLNSFELSDCGNVNPYENPTVLQFNDIKTFSNAWFGQKYRPMTRWKDVYSSYDGKAQLKDYASSGLSNIKTWACKRHSSVPVILEDTVSRTTVELLPLPVEVVEKDSELGNWKERMLDPIEIYGYHLGLCLNTQTLRNGSIYLRYNLTFPVKFDNETKERIRQGLRRGLLRSLPASLVYSEKWKDADFQVIQSVSEPVALVASVMPQLGLDDFDKCSYYAFAVFDFGGGTTDFSAGFYREATEEEEDEYGTEKIIKIVKTSGDAGLGGERIIDLLYYQVLKRNAAVLQKEGIAFTLPDGFSQFPESERLWGNGSCAHGNTSTLRENLRSVWEEQEDSVKEKITDPGALSVQFQKDSSADSVPINIDVDVEELRKCIENRIREAVIQFIHFFSQAFYQYRTREDFDELHIIFTGNSSRSSFLRKVFDEEIEKVRKQIGGNVGETTPGNIIPHFELAESSFRDSKVTLKTCVALGLLKILRGNIYPDDNSQSGDETPFNYYVGVFRRSFFKPVVKKNVAYNEWIEFGKVRKSITAGNPWILIGWSSDDRAANEGQIPENDCQQKKISFSSEYIGCDVRLRAVAPNAVEFGCFKTDSTDEEPLQTVKVYLD